MAAREINTTGASCAGSSSTRIACSTPTSSPSSHSTHHSYRPRDGLYTAPPSSFKLQQVVIIARHGDRAPIARNVGQAVQDSPETQALWLSKLPSSQEVEAWTSAFPLADPSLRPVDYDEHPYAQLTRKGAQELQALGRHLRKRYVTDLKWLPASLHASGGHAPHASGGLSSAPSSSSPPSSSPPSFLHARATNIRRTQQSAQNLLLGLYPDGAPHPSPSSSAPPLAIQVRPTASETLYPNADRSCCRQGEIIAELASRHFDMPRAHVEDMTREAFARLGLVPHPEPASAKVDPAVPPPPPPHSRVPWNQVREVWTCHAVHDLPLPPPVNGVGGGKDAGWFERVASFTSRLWGALFREEEMLRLGMGRFVEELLERLEGKARGGEGAGEKLVVYAGHDSTVVPLLVALGLWEDVWPPYAANLVLELAEREGPGAGEEGERHFVRVLYNDEERMLWAKEGDADVGGRWYSLREISGRLRKLVPKDFEEECRCRHEEKSEGEGVEHIGSAIK